MSDFKKGVLRVVKLVPYGKVISYGQVALYVGIPRAARQVGWTLNQLKEGEKVPWWRVVNNFGRISIKGSNFSAAQQRDLLIKEGVEVSEDLTFEIDKYRFMPDKNLIKELGLDQNYLEMISKHIRYSKYFR
ncbi:MGMT family protein [Candidatus Woesebacteria bacterium]|nr:MGMT family protein [Candidatus Woesebacteria bacterium]